MLPNPSNLQNESTEAVESNNDGTLPIGPSEHPVHHPSIAKPISVVDIGLEGQDERPDEEERSELIEDDPSDEDTDMSDGGAALTMTLSHAQLDAEIHMIEAELAHGDQVDAELDLLEADLIALEHNFAPQMPYVFEEGVLDNELDPAPAYMPNLPVAMSAVAQQLQHMQDQLDGQEHAIFPLNPNAQHGVVQDNMDALHNLSLFDFLRTWAQSRLGGDAKKRPRGPSLPAVERQREMVTATTTRGDLHGEDCDIQRINWTELGVSRLEARQMRRQTYKNYTNLRQNLLWHPRWRLSDDEDYFRFRKMNFDHSVHLSHFQLRNLLSCASRDHIFYAGSSVVKHYAPTSDPESESPPSIALDLTNPTIEPIHASSANDASSGIGVQISTLTVGHDILVAGGFSGEYGLVNLRAPKETKHTEGVLTQHFNGITNHVKVYLPRNSSSPVAAFASNDKSVRILDVTTNKFIAEHKYEYAINCTAVSPDRRLRVLVGDSRNVMICNAETGEVLHDLEGHQGHRDFGFACDWADDGWTVATGNQDMQVKIWDARKWKSCSGIPCPVATITAEMAGVRQLKFSPLGSGKRVLVAAEPADFVNIIDAETFRSKQSLSFFGEIGGVDFTNDGQDLIVANCDSMRGGIMEFERCNFAAEGHEFIDEHEDYAAVRRRTRGRERGYDWKSSDAEIVRNAKARGTEMQRRRRAAMLGTNMGIF